MIKAKYKLAFEHFASVYPHEAYETFPELFWEYFKERCPEVTKEEMEKILEGIKVKAIMPISNQTNLWKSAPR